MARRVLTPVGTYICWINQHGAMMFAFASPRRTTVVLCFALATASPAGGQTSGATNETPARLQPTNYGFDYVRRDVMIPMRDRVSLHTIILVPNGTHGAPMLMTRTPYDANALTTHAQSAHLGSSLMGYDNALDVIIGGGFIRVMQDVRGKYGSGGEFVTGSCSGPRAGNRVPENAR
jgi:predicted acyl esterase